MNRHYARENRHLMVEEHLESMATGSQPCIN